MGLSTPPHRVLARLKTPATKNLASLRNGFRARNERIIRPLMGAKKPLLRDMRRGLSESEYEMGRLSQPYTWKNMTSGAVISPMFCISEQHGPQNRNLGLSMTYPDLRSTPHPT